MFSKLKFSFKDLLIGILLISPIFILVLISYNPAERKAAEQDSLRRNNVNALARAAEAYFKEYSFYPENPNELISSGTIATLPENSSEYEFKSDSEHLVVYSKAQSLEITEYCSGEDTYIVYSSFNKRTDIVCGEVSPGDQKFVN